MLLIFQCSKIIAAKFSADSEASNPKVQNLRVLETYLELLHAELLFDADVQREMEVTSFPNIE